MPEPPSAAGRDMLLLTGVPNIGKTTFIRRLAAGLSGWRLAGFYTEEIRVGPVRVGFRISTWGGISAVMAHVDISGPHRVGQYGIDTVAIDRVLAQAHGSDAEAYLIDEIGRMECQTAGFASFLQQALTSGKPVVATVALHGGGLVEEIKSGYGALLWQLTRENSEALLSQAVNWLYVARKRTLPSDAAHVPVAFHSINALTLATHEMARAVAFYRALGFILHQGGEQARHSSFWVGACHLNLIAQPPNRQWGKWGRVLFYVNDVDELYRRALVLGLHPMSAPRDADWGERYFHIRDPDGHELSFARPLAPPG